MRLFDLHCDTISTCFQKNCNLSHKALAIHARTLQRANFSFYTQTFALWIPDTQPKPWALYQNLLATAKKVLPQAGFGSVGRRAVLAVEGGALLEKDLGRVERLWADGVRMLSLTWNGETPLAGGAYSKAGLTPLGREVILEMNRLGMVLDVSHLNAKSFYSVVDLADRVVATHSNAYAVCPHPRNLTDHQLKLLAQKGAVVGLCPYSAFLGQSCFKGLYANLCYMQALGVKTAVGSDFDGAKMPRCLNGPHKFANLRRYLVQKGLKSQDLDQFFYQNAETFFNDFTNGLF